MLKIVAPQTFGIGDQVVIKQHDKVLTVTARPAPNRYHLFTGAGKAPLCNVPGDLIEPVTQPFVPGRRAEDRLIVTNTLGRAVRTPEQVLADSLAKARERLPAGARATSMDGRHGVIHSVDVINAEVIVRVALDDNTLVRERAGYWSWSIA